MLSYTQCFCPEPGGHLTFRQHSTETIAPHFCYFAEAGFLLTVRGGVKVVVTDSMRKCFGQDLKQRILIVPFVLCPKSCWWTAGGYLILRILMKSLSERLFLDFWVNLIIFETHSFFSVLFFHSLLSHICSVSGHKWFLRVSWQVPPEPNKGYHRDWWGLYE